MSGWLPGCSWLWHPSGAAVAPEDVTWRRRLLDAPILAHPLGAWAVVGFMAFGGVQGFGAWWAVLLAEGINQYYKGWHAKAYGRYLWREVLWRLLISAVATLPAWWWL